eukprot:CAMPEP_0179140876 /NCGR_PEP_ID=MMETSP0796-20121207/67510_1 /TAXON_ID=73915 /ORGANISM="Pyrodinium bahamense, Strain pbaha01" /LENGTH=76 /DNA_ID=CAMNT_0020840509 /DNA_START=1 /DNA_END=227 /DNA_ORIENTATION=+
MEDMLSSRDAQVVGAPSNPNLGLLLAGISEGEHARACPPSGQPGPSPCRASLTERTTLGDQLDLCGGMHEGRGAPT